MRRQLENSRANEEVPTWEDHQRWDGRRDRNLDRRRSMQPRQTAVLDGQLRPPCELPQAPTDRRGMAILAFLNRMSQVRVVPAGTTSQHRGNTPRGRKLHVGRESGARVS